MSDLRYVECPNRPLASELSLTGDDVSSFIFMAGGISHCPDWQKPLASRFLETTNAVIFNPRRENFTFSIKTQEEQITWEFDYLALCRNILFWFPSETLCPITLFELGKISTSNKNIVVGCHYLYKRRDDVVEQLKLAKPNIVVLDCLDEIYDKAIDVFRLKRT